MVLINILDTVLNLFYENSGLIFLFHSKKFKETCFNKTFIFQLLFLLFCLSYWYGIRVIRKLSKEVEVFLDFLYF